MLKRTFTLGKYHCVEALGSGPLGETWRAKRYGIAGVERQFALKRIHARLLGSADFVQRLERATQAYRKLRHEGLVPLHEVGREEQQHYLVFDFAGPADLHKLRAALQRGAAEDPARVQGVVVLIGKAVATALQAAHEQGVVHLGLRPSCVLIDRQGQVRVADTGLLQARLSGPWAEAPDMLRVLPYLSPEVLRGERADPRSDVFSLGAVLFELLTFAPAFSGDTPARIRTQVERGLRAAPINHGMPGPGGDLKTGLWPILQRALSARPEARPASMAELLQALGEVPVPGEEAIRGQLQKLGRRLQGPEATARPPSSLSEPGADPLPPPPGQRSEEGRAFASPMEGLADRPVEGMVPSRNSDVLRDVPLMVTSAQILARSASGPQPQLQPLTGGAEPKTVPERRRPEALRLHEGRFGEQRGPVPPGPRAEGLAGRVRAAMPVSSGPAVARRVLPSAAFTMEEEESTVPVPHSPRSQIVIIEAEPPLAGAGLPAGLSDETPLPRSIPMGSTGPNPSIEPTRVDSDPARHDVDPSGPARLPGLAAPPPGAALWSSFADSGPTTLPDQPSPHATAEKSGAGVPLARVIPGRPSAKSPPARPKADGDTDSAVLLADDSDLFGASRLGSLPRDPLATGAAEPAPAESRKQAHLGKRPAGFTDFDEPTALADYSDSALAGLVGMSLRDRSGPVSMATGAPPVPGQGAQQVPPPASALADAYAPLITAPVPLSPPEDEPALAMPAPEPSVPLPIPVVTSVPVVQAPQAPMAIATDLSPPDSSPGGWIGPQPQPIPQAELLAGQPLGQPGMRRGLLLMAGASFLCSLLFFGVGAPRLYRWVRGHRPSTGQQAVASLRVPAPTPTPLPRPAPVSEQPPPKEVKRQEPAPVEEVAPPPAPGGTLSVTSSPPAMVFLDGRQSGRTPTTLKLSAGKHALLLLAEKRQLLRREVVAGAPLSVTLEPAKLSPPVYGNSGLKVRCASKGQLRILVDEQDTGVSCPSGRIKVSPGPHHVGFFSPATNEVVTRDITVKKGNSSTRLYTKY